jgi:hypothetical protein
MYDNSAGLDLRIPDGKQATGLGLYDLTDLPEWLKLAAEAPEMARLPGVTRLHDREISGTLVLRGPDKITVKLGMPTVIERTFLTWEEADRWMREDGTTAYNEAP